jgi:hypothetical protein
LIRVIRAQKADVEVTIRINIRVRETRNTLSTVKDFVES